MKVNGSVGRQALSSLGFSPLILLLSYTVPLSHCALTPGILSFHTVKDILTVNITAEKQMTSLPPPFTVTGREIQVPFV